MGAQLMILEVGVACNCFVRSFAIGGIVEDLFSRRNNLRRLPPITVREDAPVAFRKFIFDAMKHFCRNPISCVTLIYLSIGKIPDSSYVFRGYDGDRAWSFAKDELFKADWYKVFDLIERFHPKLWSPRDHDSADAFREVLNNYFEENGYAYRLEPNGKLAHRGDESFESAMSNARVSLATAGMNTAASEIHKSLEDLAKRPIGDLTGAIQHAMAGLECAAKDAAGESGIELGKIVKKRPDLFPAPLGDVIAKLYGFASNNGRHLQEGGEPDFAEAELIVGIAATAATYLARKSVS